MPEVKATTRTKPRPEVERWQEAPAGARVIALTRGWVAWVDESDHDRLNQFWWQSAARGSGLVYATRGIRRNGKSKTFYMHREVMGAAAAFVDHIRHRPEIRVVDNRRSNLRFVTEAENTHNRRKRARGTSSRFLGVCRLKGVWVAQIKTCGRILRLAECDEEAEAARAYDAAASYLRGVYARLNFPAEIDAARAYDSEARPLHGEFARTNFEDDGR